MRIPGTGSSPTPWNRGRATGGLVCRRPGASQQVGQPLLIGEEGIVAVALRFELPQRGLRAGRLQLPVQLLLQRPGEQHVPGHTDNHRLRGDLLEGGAELAVRRGDGPAVDGLAQQQERAYGKLLGEAAAMMIEILGYRRTLEPGHQSSEADVQLHPAAIGEHAQLPGAAHAGGHIAIAPAVTDQLALQMAGRGAPSVWSQARRDQSAAGSEPGAGRQRTPTIPPRLAPTKVTAV